LEGASSGKHRVGPKGSETRYELIKFEWFIFGALAGTPIPTRRTSCGLRNFSWVDPVSDFRTDDCRQLQFCVFVRDPSPNKAVSAVLESLDG
jgi:hypothetical protein